MKRGKLVGIILVILLLAGAGAVYYWHGPVEEVVEDTLAEETTPVDSIPHIYLYDICIDSLIPQEYTIARGETFGTILKKNNLSPDKLDEVNEAAKGSDFDARLLQAGKRYYTLTEVSSNKLRYLIFQKTLSEATVIDMSDTCRVYNSQKQITLKRKYAAGVIKGSLWDAIKSSKSDPLLALMMADIYAWTIDFFDLQRGDTFKVIYEQSYVDDSVSVEIASIRGAEFVHNGEKYYAIPLMQDSILQYFDDKGNSLRRKFLKAPLKFSRVSSGFSHGRMHPILKVLRPHHGIDYAASIGTSVYSVGDGEVITEAAQSKEAGRFIVIRHDDTYTSTYMHLSRYAPDVKVGSKVKQGDVIGYVGNSGLATGPHLDFRIHKNGRAVNPMKLELPPMAPVKPELKEQFESVKNDIIRELDGLKIE